MQTENLAFAIVQRALAEPERPAFVRNDVVSYRRFADLAVHFARRMQALGVDRHSVVGLSMTSSLIAALAITAVSLLGARWLSIASNTTNGLPVEVTHVFAGLSRGQAGWHTLDQDWFDAPTATESAVQELPGQASPDDTWTLASSSGTTGTPKYMAISYGLIWRRSMQAETDRRGPPTLVNLFPATTHVGVRFDLATLALGGTNVAVARWDALATKGVTLVLGSPSHLARRFRRSGPPATRLPACRITGGPVSERFVETALRYFDEVQLLYGATEAGTIALGRFSAQTPYDGSVGRPVAGVKLEVIDAQGHACPPQVEGVVRIRSDRAIGGYVGQAEFNAAIFRDGWFYPGDLARIDQNGAVHITGRTDDVINVGGAKLNAIEIDKVLEQHPDIVDGYSFVHSDAGGASRLAAIVSLRAGAVPENLRSLNHLMMGRLHRRAWPRHVYVADAVPRNENGKPMRGAAAAMAPALPVVELT